MEQFVFLKLHARDGEEKAVEEALREVMAPSHAEPGCLNFPFLPLRPRPARSASRSSRAWARKDETLRSWH